MLKKKYRILVANRGEIAKRICHSIKQLNAIPIGLYAKYAPDEPHLAFCDEWIPLEGNNLRETFLNIQQITELMLKYQIDAVHPGYGFLSENSHFAKAVRDLGKIFIGPPTDSISQMGDKAVSKKIAHQAGVPTVPGPLKIIESVDDAIEESQRIGFPVLLKASAGGGGKGMRICENISQVKDNFESAQREALNAFGNQDMLVEKYIVGPHHIEVQVFGTGDQKLYHLFERECSIQRRNQKIIEEVPSPFIGNNQPLREEICSEALKLARAVNYRSAGTVEFIMGEDQKFYFLEMNTRLQVEHPITEEVTGVDLVRWMITDAFEEFEKAPIQKQEELVLRGAAIECRICAEDSLTMLPTPGPVYSFLDHSLPHIRFDHGLIAGMNVRSDFDPMIGKLISYGMNRQIAIEKMEYALKNLGWIGHATNIELLLSILKNIDFINKKYDTHFLKKYTNEELLQNLKLLKNDGVPKSFDSDVEGLFDQACSVLIENYVIKQ